MLYQLDKPFYASIVSVLGEHIVIGLIDHALAMILVAKTFHRFANVGEIALHRDIMSIGMQNAIVVALDQDLASLGADRLEMPG